MGTLNQAPGCQGAAKKGAAGPPMAGDGTGLSLAAVSKGLHADACLS